MAKGERVGRRGEHVAVVVAADHGDDMTIGPGSELREPGGLVQTAACGGDRRVRARGADIERDPPVRRCRVPHATRAAVGQLAKEPLSCAVNRHGLRHRISHASNPVRQADSGPPRRRAGSRRHGYGSASTRPPTPLLSASSSCACSIARNRDRSPGRATRSIALLGCVRRGGHGRAASRADATWV
jgi:hypothetical protein